MSPNSARRARGDALYEAVSEGRRAIGLEHWLPLFYEQARHAVRLCRRRAASCSTRAPRTAAQARFAQIADYYAARARALRAGPRHRRLQPLQPDRLYLDRATEWRARLAAGAARAAARRSRPRPSARDVIDCGGRVGRDFAPERQNENVNVFEAAVAPHPRAARARPASVVVAGWSDGSRERLEPRARRARAEDRSSSSRRWPQAKSRARRRAAAGGDRARARLRGRRSRDHRRAGHSRRPPRAPAPSASAAPRTCSPRPRR